MATYPPPVPPPPGYDPREQRRVLRDQARAQRHALRYHMRSLRRSSVLGPLMLIGLGVVFLLLQALPRRIVARFPQGERAIGLAGDRA